MKGEEGLELEEGASGCCCCCAEAELLLCESLSLVCAVVLSLEKSPMVAVDDKQDEARRQAVRPSSRQAGP
jgi:hypothetical protein